MIAMQMRQQKILADNLRLEAKRNARMTAADAMTQTFTAPYAVEPIPRQPLPPVHAIKRMTYDQAYEKASIAASELVSPNSLEYEATFDRLIDELCIKHDISE